ncbi:lysophosphatidic acid receptor 4-like [Eucyclogobius newberryi]|uniref:lysophosphatidic acid receptor 4-like n=1 Tax=Eucyclogobius newberryi TaxID=166745 RepID=UPI003B5C61F9
MFNSTTESKSTTYAFIFGTVIAVGFPLNAVALWILLRRHSLRSPSAVFMINLAVSDLLLAISLPGRVYFYATGTWPLGNFACNFVTMLFRNNIRSSSIFITFISVDRLLAVVYPLRSRHVRTASNAGKAAGVVWLIVLLINIPESMTLLADLTAFNNSVCFEFRDLRITITPVNYFQPVLILTLLAVNIVSTLMVSLTLRRRVSVSAKVENKVSVMLIFAMNLAMFTIFFLPISLVILFKHFRKAITPLLCLASINCCLDPLLYYFSFDGFWKKKEEGEHSVFQTYK